MILTLKTFWARKCGTDNIKESILFLVWLSNPTNLHKLRSYQSKEVKLKCHDLQYFSLLLPIDVYNRRDKNVSVVSDQGSLVNQGSIMIENIIEI